MAREYRPKVRNLDAVTSTRKDAHTARWYDGSGPGRHLRMCPDCKRPADADFRDHGGQCVKGTR